MTPHPNPQETIAEAAVGILLIIGDKGSPVAVLQVRAPNDSWPGACQVTAHRKLSGDDLVLLRAESYANLVQLAARKELGDPISDAIFAAEDHLVLLTTKDTPKPEGVKRVLTFGLRLQMPWDEFKRLVVREPGVAFRSVENAGQIQLLGPPHKISGVPANEIRMFDDERSAVELAFERIPEE